MSSIHPELNPDSIMVGPSDVDGTSTIEYQGTPGMQVYIESCDYSRFAGGTECDHIETSKVDTNGIATAKITILPDDKQINVRSQTSTGSSDFLARKDLASDIKTGEVMLFLMVIIFWATVITVAYQILRKLFQTKEA